MQIPIWVSAFFICGEGFEPIKCNSPVDCCSIPARRNRHLTDNRIPHPLRCGFHFFIGWENPLAAERRQDACELLSILSHQIWWGFEPIKCKAPVEPCSIPARRNRHLIDIRIPHPLPGKRRKERKKGRPLAAPTWFLTGPWPSLRFPSAAGLPGDP